LLTELDLNVRADPCQGRPIAINAVREQAHVLIGALHVNVHRRVIQDPQDWPENGIEPDGTGLMVQTDLLFACDAVARRTYPGFTAAWLARSGATRTATGSPA
jgi:hypothetical protein